MTATQVLNGQKHFIYFATILVKYVTNLRYGNECQKVNELVQCRTLHNFYIEYKQAKICIINYSPIHPLTNSSKIVQYFCYSPLWKRVIAWVESSCPSDCGKVWGDVGYSVSPQTIPQSLGQLLSTQAITLFQSGL